MPEYLKGLKGVLAAAATVCGLAWLANRIPAIKRRLPGGSTATIPVSEDVPGGPVSKGDTIGRTLATNEPPADAAEA